MFTLFLRNTDPVFFFSFSSVTHWILSSVTALRVTDTLWWVQMRWPAWHEGRSRFLCVRAVKEFGKGCRAARSESEVSDTKGHVWIMLSKEPISPRLYKVKPVNSALLDWGFDSWLEGSGRLMSLMDSSTIWRRLPRSCRQFRKRPRWAWTIKGHRRREKIYCLWTLVIKISWPPRAHWLKLFGGKHIQWL